MFLRKLMGPLGKNFAIHYEDTQRSDKQNQVFGSRYRGWVLENCISGQLIIVQTCLNS